MYIETFIPFVGFFVFLFSLYILAHDDFFLFRKNITLEKLFDMSFVCGIVALFFARLVYVIFHFKPLYTNPLAFFLFPYFPGLSFAGGLFGAMVALVTYCRAFKLPLGKIMDFTTLSFFPAVIISNILLIVFKRSHVVIEVSAVFILIFIYAGLLYAMKRMELKDGSLSSLGFLLMSSIFITLDFITLGKKFFTGDFILFSLILVGSLIIIFINEEAFGAKFGKK